MRKLKDPMKYTLEECRALADETFPPPWSLLEAIGILVSAVEKLQQKQKEKAA